MLRSSLSSLTFSPIRLSVERPFYHIHHRRRLAHSPRRLNAMAEPCNSKMVDEEMLAPEQPSTDASPSTNEEKELPKLSAQEYRIYNRMAEHMNMFVRLPFDPVHLSKPMPR